LSSEALHAPRERLSEKTISLHQLEWPRRSSADSDANLRTYLFRDGNVLQLETGKPT
jgi:hypothetical protein